MIEKKGGAGACIKYKGRKEKQTTAIPPLILPRIYRGTMHRYRSGLKFIFLYCLVFSFSPFTYIQACKIVLFQVSYNPAGTSKRGRVREKGIYY